MIWYYYVIYILSIYLSILGLGILWYLFIFHTYSHVLCGAYFIRCISYPVHILSDTLRNLGAYFRRHNLFRSPIRPHFIITALNLYAITTYGILSSRIPIRWCSFIAIFTSITVRSEVIICCFYRVPPFLLMNILRKPRAHWLKLSRDVVYDLSEMTDPDRNLAGIAEFRLCSWILAWIHDINLSYFGYWCGNVYSIYILKLYKIFHLKYSENSDFLGYGIPQDPATLPSGYFPNKSLRVFASFVIKAVFSPFGSVRVNFWAPVYVSFGCDYFSNLFNWTGDNLSTRYKGLSLRLS